MVNSNDGTQTPKRKSGTSPSIKSLYSTPPPPLPHSVMKRSPPPGYSPMQPVRTIVVPGANVYAVSPAPMRRTPYQQYLSPEEVETGLKHGSFIKGILRINQRNYEEAYIDNPSGDDQLDILILGLKSRNRALHGDLVVCRINKRDDWVVRDVLYEAWREGRLDAKFDEDGRPISIPPKKAEEESDTASRAGIYSRGDMLKMNAQGVKAEDVTAKLQQMGLSVGAPPTRRSEPQSTRRFNHKFLSEMPAEYWGIPDICLQKTASIVHVLEANNSRCAVGQLKTMVDGNPNWALFSPSDSRMPRMMIPASEVPSDFFSRPQDFSKFIYVASLVSWPETAQFARGKLYKLLGSAGDAEAETEGMLLANQVDTRAFTESALSSLPISDDTEWSISEAEFKYRKDFRDETVFTIDPKTARDLDDALHIKRIEDCDGKGTPGYEVGVHIADVSYFVKAGTELDHWAANRGNSIYLVHRVIPMLPAVLSEELCSLNQDVDRLAFSVVWKMDSEGNVHSEWFGRSVIRSCAKLSYDEANEMLINSEKKAEDFHVGDPECKPEVITKVKASVLGLNKLAKAIKKRRVDGGSLHLDQPKMKFSLEKKDRNAPKIITTIDEAKTEHSLEKKEDKIWVPNGVALDKRGDANFLVEEFMLLANMAVAKKISDRYPETALLRRHPNPKTRLLSAVIEKCAKLGYPICGKTSGDIGTSLMKYGQDLELKHTVSPVLVQYLLNAMQLAVYFAAGRDPNHHHFALNVDHYTHFTSPIRRYPDLIVHRMLAAALDYTPIPGYTALHVDKIARLCNEKKLTGKQLSETSDEMFFGLLIREVGSLVTIGIVYNVMDQAFDVLLVKYGIIKRVPNKNKEVPVELLSLVRVNLVPVPNSTKFNAVYVPSDNPLTFKDVADYVEGVDAE